MSSDSDSALSPKRTKFNSNHALEILIKMNAQRKFSKACCHVTIKTEMKEKFEKEVSINGLSSDIMGAIIEFMYTCEINLTKENVFELLAASEQLQIPSIKECCNKFLVTCVSKGNCLQTYSFAKKNCLHDVVRKAEKCILCNLFAVVIQPEFMSVNAEDLLAILQVKQRNISEETLFHAVVSWVNYDRSLRKSYFCDLFKNILLSYLCSDFLRDVVQNESLVMECHGCFSLLPKTLIRHAPESSASDEFSHILVIAYEGRNTLENFKMVENQWILMPTSNCDAMSVRKGATSVCVDKKVYFIGGGSDEAVNSVESLSLIAENPVWHPEKTLLRKRHYSASAVLNDIIYVTGGCDGDVIGTCEQFDIRRDEWSWFQEMSGKRGGHGMVALNGKLYVAGGLEKEVLSTVECYDISTKQWTYLASMNQKRVMLCLIVLHGKMFAIGGFGGTNCLSSMEIYDPEAESWVYGAPLICPRSGAAACVVNGKIYVIGGKNEQEHLLLAEVYDPALGAWKIHCGLNGPSVRSFELDV
ncbi:kelch-like protein 12 [Clavelina lepadiformis]|uniref:kelch-like protein 12 n=1 Tax=Clavelina lepadiformis TaxID=159417 RepID=UPI004043267B